MTKVKRMKQQCELGILRLQNRRLQRTIDSMEHELFVAKSNLALTCVAFHNLVDDACMHATAPEDREAYAKESLEIMERLVKEAARECAAATKQKEGETE